MFQPLHGSSGSGELPALSVSLEEFLSSDRVRLRTDDDVSLILATCGRPGAARLMDLTLLRSGETLRLGQQLGRGGEGTVFAVDGRPGQVAKVYTTPPGPTKVPQA